MDIESTPIESVLPSEALVDAGLAAPVAGEIGQGSTDWLQTLVLVGLRVAFFLACRYYVDKFLLTDLKSVIRVDGLQSGLESPIPGGPGSPTGQSFQLDDVEKGYFAGQAALKSSAGSTHRLSPSRSRALNLSLPASSSNVPRLSPPPSPSFSKRVQSQHQSQWYPKLSTTLFCSAFSESCMLFTLVLFGDTVSDSVRLFNWSSSLFALVLFIIFVIPLGLCLLLTHRTRTPPGPRDLALAGVPFVAYLFLFYKGGSLVAAKTVVGGSHSSGFINGALSRICVPGVVLIAILSGGGAVNTAWEAFEWRTVSSREVVTEASVMAAERSLYRARMERQRQEEAILDAEDAVAREGTSGSILARWTSSSPAAAQLASLRLALTGMESLEGQMVKDVATLKKRKQAHELGKTFKGKLWLGAGWALSVYCVWRVIISLVNLIFGYGHKAPPPPVDELGGEVAAPPRATDLVTALLGRLASLFDLDIDVPTVSRMIGLLLIGSIIVANMRSVLASVSRIFKATSSGVGASFMLLLLAELMSIYLLTSLISLPSSSSETSTVLLDTLPSFDVFSRLFDLVFLIAAGSVIAVRWLEKRLRSDDHLSTQYQPL